MLPSSVVQMLENPHLSMLSSENEWVLYRHVLRQLNEPSLEYIPTKKNDSRSYSSILLESIMMRMNNSEADIILRLVDPTRPQWAEDERIDEALSFSKKPILRIETKQDLEKWYLGKDIDYKIDSTNKTGFDELLEAIAEKLPEGPYLYDEDQYTDQTMDLRISEVIREQLFASLGEEIPYACYVEIGSIENGADEIIIPSNSDLTPENFAPKNKKGKLPMLSIQAYINTETDSQKTIIIGKQGRKIQDIGTASRLILEEIFGKKVFLALRVKVDKNWRKNAKTLERLFPKK